MRKESCSAITAFLLALSIGPAEGVQQVRSLYTAVDLTSCRRLDEPAGGGAWLCEGLKGYPLYVSEGALRIYLGVGPKAQRTRAAKQTLAAANSIFEGKSSRTTVEWRFIIRQGAPVPYATIVRYFTQSDTRRGEVLVVTRVTPSEACHVAYIDAVANKDAIVLARRIADAAARSFDCNSEPKAEGTTGKSPM